MTHAFLGCPLVGVLIFVFQVLSDLLYHLILSIVLWGQQVRHRYPPSQVGRLRFRELCSDRSPRPNSSVPRLPLSFDISSGKHMQALLFGPITEVILEGTTSNHSCLLTQGPSDHPGAGLGSHLEERALVLVVQCGQLSWLLSDRSPLADIHSQS